MRRASLLSIVIPVYASERYLSGTVSELCAALDGTIDFEIVLVNDGSPDDVQTVMDSIRTRDRRIRAVSLPRNVGQHRAILRGFVASRGDIVATIDDDGQNPPAAVLAVVEALKDRDLDVVYGRFATVEASPARRVASRLNRWISRHTISNRSGIAISNVRALRGDLARWLGDRSVSYPYLDAMILNATNRIGEVPVEHRPRAGGKSSYTVSKLVRLWFSHLTTLTLWPLRVAVVGSFGISVLALVVGILQIARALIERRAPQGWLSIFTAVSFFFSVLFLFLGIISVYVGRMYVSLNDFGASWERAADPRDESTNGVGEGARPWPT